MRCAAADRRASRRVRRCWRRAWQIFNASLGDVSCRRKEKSGNLATRPRPRKRATSKERKDVRVENKRPDRNRRRPGELVDVVARTISYYVDAKQFCVLKSDFEILEPGQQQPTEWYARVDFSANISKADAVAALKMMMDEIENAGLPATVRQIDRRGADMIIKCQKGFAEASAIYETLPPALQAKADRIFSDRSLQGPPGSLVAISLRRTSSPPRRPVGAPSAEVLSGETRRRS